MRTIKIDNQKELDALAVREPDVARIAETMRELERYPLTLVLGDDVTIVKFADDIYGPTVAEMIERHWLHTPSIISDDGLSCGYRVESVGLVSAPIDPNCKIADAWATRTPAEILADVQDGLAAHFNVPSRMLTGEYKTRLDVGGNHQLQLYVQHSGRLTAALDKVRKAKNHGPRGKWGKLK